MRPPIPTPHHPDDRPAPPRTRTRLRILAAALAVLIACALAGGVALARRGARAIGTGVAVIDTNLAYAGGAAAGTGMVLTPSGEVLTNNHVIRGATSIKITLPGTGRSYSARVVGYDVVHDVAVLQAVGASRLKTVSTASARAAVGQSVTAVGNAGGTGRLTSATGSVTGVGKSISVSDGRGGSSRLTGLIETNANVVPGDSGGPLLNSAGNVIGMDTAGSVEYGIGASSTSQAYAIPIARVLSIARQVESGQSSARVHVGGTPFLGIEVASATASPWAPDVGGAVVTGVVPGGPADAAGLTPGDVITGIGGRSVSSPDSLTSALLARKPGQKVAISYTDQLGASQTATVTLTSGPAQ